ncbi:hypothetical protein [Alkanindiges illinoisensis]|uniref:hypothetical protein n=1 Tax=Alkanindiges illinoisensis TaxID=197183 RepID=UPI000478DBD0|nr:hypothetical protein [Alkanindiges illinoisensis]
MWQTIINLIVYISFTILSISNTVYADSTLQALDDEALAAETGQALFNLSYLAPGQAGNPMTSGSGIGFYTLGMEAELSINANIKKLQAGCGGINGANGCDLDIDNFSLGCIANSAGTCISLPKTGNQIDGAVTDNSIANQSQMKDFVLTNPFFQFAIKDPDTASTREVVGIRIGASNVKGPMSFGQINSFSGYLTVTANLSMIGGDNVAVTCRYPASCIAPGANTSGIRNNGASSWGAPQTGNIFTGVRGGKGTPSGGYLGLGDDMILDIGLAHIRYQEALVSYQTVNRTGIGVLLNGNRQTQAQLAGINLAGVVNSIVYGNTDGSTTVGASPLELSDSDAGALVGAFGPTLLPLLRGGIADQIKRQLAQGLLIYNSNSTSNQTTINGKSDEQIHADLNSYILPYNVSNLHQANVDSPLFGLSLQQRSIQYPGYAAAVARGWSMYMPDAFTLNINSPVATQYNSAGTITQQGLINNILQSSNARDGNIVGLEPAYRTCYGGITYC